MSLTPFAFHRGDFTEQEKRIVLRCLADKRGLRSLGIEMRAIGHNRQSWYDGSKVISVPTNFQPTIMLYKQSHVSMRQQFPSSFSGLSVTNLGTNPIEIHLHQDNWTAPPSVFDGSREQYREYLLQHEFLHALGYAHNLPPARATQPCPVMFQQTKGTRGVCRPNPWILKSEEVLQTLTRQDDQ